jgi:hypothetical protein
VSTVLPVARRLRGRITGMLPVWLRDRLRARAADLRDRREWRRYRWRPTVPPPHIVKVRTVLACAQRHRARVLVETGTFEGEMVRKCLRVFREIHSIELSPDYAREARRRFAAHPHVHIVEGDSATKLAEVLDRVHEPAVFWLDGHFSGGATARGRHDTPLAAELVAIARHGRHDHVILVDDARHLGQGDYPSVAWLTERLHAIEPSYRIEIADDILRCEPTR